MLPDHPNELAQEAPRRRYGKLRIAWSVGWGVVTLLLILLWVRSYRWYDSLSGPLYQQRQFRIATTSGRLLVYHGSKGSLRPPQQTWRLKTISNVEKERAESGLKQKFIPEYFVVTYHYFIAPYWFVGLFAVAFTGLPWLPRRISLRSLLIVTTLVAVLLGLIVYLAR